MARPQFVEGSLHYHESFHGWYLYGTEAHQNETALVHQLDDQEPQGDPNDDYELCEAYDFDLVSQELADNMHSYTVKYDECWNTRELEQDFDLGQATFGYGVISWVRRNSDGVYGSLDFSASPRVYFDWREKNMSLG